MAGARKLQAEIDRTLKRIEEGIQAFDDQLDRVKESDTQAMKEKNEEDLKKEIKKLQRYRDAIKIWLSSAEVKQKQPLIEARSLIERRMETFKVVERETKTKAYSREGLARDSTLTAEEKRRLKTREWVQDMVQALSDDIDATEAELEAFEGGLAAGAPTGGKAGKAAKEAQVAKMNSLISNHRWHIDRLEALTRMLDNETVEPEDVDNIKEDLDYYMEQAKEDGFEMDVGLYDSFEGLTLGEGTNEDSDFDDDDYDDPPARSSSISGPSSSSTTASALATAAAGGGGAKAGGAATSAAAPAAGSTASISSSTAAAAGAAGAKTPAVTPAASAATAARTPSAGGLLTGTKPALPAVGSTSVPPAVVTAAAAGSAAAKAAGAGGGMTPTATASSTTGSGVLSSVGGAAGSGAASTAAGATTAATTKLPVTTGPTPGPTVASAAAAVAAGKASGAPAPSVTMSPALPQSKVAAAAAGMPLPSSGSSAAAGTLLTPSASAATTAAGAAAGVAASSSVPTTAAAVVAGGKSFAATAGGGGAATAGATAATVVKTVVGVGQQPFPSLQQAAGASSSAPSSTVSAGVGGATPGSAQPSLASIVRGTTTTTATSAATAATPTPVTSAPPAAAMIGTAPNALTPAQQQQQAAAALAARNATGLPQQPQQPLQQQQQQPQAVAASLAQQQQQMQQMQQMQQAQQLQAQQQQQQQQQFHPQAAGLPTLLPAGLASSAGLAAAIAAATTPAPTPSILDSTSLAPIPLANQRFNIASLQLSLAHIPEAMDSERPKQYVPRNAAAVHAAFPPIPATALDPTPQLFSRLEPDTLFFCYYYMQNTHSQYLAARELRRQGWRYSNRTCTFYRRAPAEGAPANSGALAPVEEVSAVGPDGLPQVAGDRGTFIAFEYESGWVSRTKKDLMLPRAEWADRDVAGQLGLGAVPAGAIGGPGVTAAE